MNQPTPCPIHPNRSHADAGKVGGKCKQCQEFRRAVIAMRGTSKYDPTRFNADDRRNMAARVVIDGVTIAGTAREMGTSEATVRKWVRYYLDEFIDVRES